MRQVRDLFGDLVERRLWPIALALVIALVAVPVLLAKSPSEATTDQPAPSPVAVAATAPGAPRPGEPVVSIAGEDAPSAPLRGHAKNPFRQQYEEKKETETSSAGTAGSGDGSDTSGGSTGGTGGPVVVRKRVYPSIDVRFGHAGRALHLIQDVPPLTPLPRTEKPVLIYIGFLRSDPTKVGFMVSSDVHVQPLDRRACVPSRRLCQGIILRRGDVVFLDYTEPDGDVVQYELELVDLVYREATSQAQVDAAYADASKVGRQLLRRAARHAARRAQARGALHARAVTGTTPQAPSLDPLP